jgi:hypothetical protein
LKLLAKPLRPLFAMPIQAANLLLDVLFDFSTYSLGNILALLVAVLGASWMLAPVLGH